MGAMQAKASEAASADKTSVGRRRHQAQATTAEYGPNPLWQGMAMGVTGGARRPTAGEPGLVQRMCSDCAAEAADQSETRVQAQARGASPTEALAGGDPVQRLCQDCEEERDRTSLTQHHAVQMWNCREYGPPTCTVQGKEDGQPPIQAKCTACEQDAVQRQSAPHHKRSPVAVQQAASRGLTDANQPLPHADRIQASFGRHDVSGVRTGIGGAASKASQRMGALAYTSGDRIGFRQPPDLRLAAHEAAHTIQQRSGLKLPGNVGQPGDRWERHADRVADAVVAGESAEPLLDEVAPGGGPRRPAKGEGLSDAVQHRLTSLATHRVEGPAGGAAPATGGGTAGVSEETAEQRSEHHEETGATRPSGAGDQPPPPEEAAQPEAACEAAAGEDRTTAEPPPGNAGGGQGAGGTEPEAGERLGECYNAASPPRPEDTPEPEGDSEPNAVEEHSEVDFPEWEAPNDACDCEVGEALQQTAGQVPAEVTIEDGGEAPVQGAAPQGEATEGGDHPEAEGAQLAEAGTQGAAAGAEGGRGDGEGERGGAGGMAQGAFRQGEAQRDAAIAEYRAAGDELLEIPDRADRLSRGLDFAGAQPGSAADAVRRATALATIGDFMQDAAGQVREAIAFVRTEVPERLGGLAEATKAAIDDDMAEQRAAISARIAQARNRASALASATRALILAKYQGQVARVNTETDAAIETLQSAYETATESIGQRETTALGEVNERFARGRADHDAKGEEYGQGAIRRGQQHVDHYERCKVNRNYEDDGFWDGCLSVRRYHAQQKAACKTASGFYKNMTETARRKGHDLREQRTQYRCGVISGASQFQATLDSTLERLISGLESGRAGTLAGLAQARDMNLQAVNAALTATLGRLDQREREQRQAVNDSGYIQQVAMEQLAHGVAVSLARSVGAAMTSLEATLEQLREQLTRGDAPDPLALVDALAPAREGLAGGMGTLLDKMEEGAGGAERQLVNAGFDALEALQAITRGNATATGQAEERFAAQMRTLMNAAESSMALLADRQVGKAQESAVQGSDSMRQLASGFEQATEQIYQAVDEAIGESLGELQTDLDHMKGILDGKIIREANEAAAKEQPAWKGVVAVVLIVLVIIVSIVVTVLTLGAGAPFLAVVLVGAIVGAITAGLIQVINNWAAGEEWSQGLVQAMVIGAVGGALGGAIGAGANGLAQAAVQGALRAGSSRLVSQALNVGINLAGDLVSEGLTQGFAYVAYGQDFNWQGFVMAGGMSMASTVRAGPAGPRGGTRGDGIGTPAPSATRTGGAAAGARSVRGALADLGVGLGLAGSVELLDAAMGGDFDATRFASAAAAGAAGSRAAAYGARRSRTPSTEVPTSGLGRARARVGGARDRAFARLELSETSTAARRSQGVMDSVENWFARGAGATLGRLRDGTGRVPEAPASVSERPRPRTQEADEASRARHKAEDTSGPRPLRSHSDAELAAPANRLSDAEMADLTATRSRVGDADHDFSARRRSGDEVKAEACSRACGILIGSDGKISRIIQEVDSLPGSSQQARRLRSELEALSARIKSIEDRIEGRLRSGEYQASEEVVNLARIAAEDFQTLGLEFRSLGDALNTPSQLSRSELFPLSGRPERNIQVRRLQGSEQLEATVQVARDGFTDVVSRGILRPDQQCIYVLRDGNGAILKVGKSSAGNAEGRFRKYRTAGADLEMDLSLEVTPLKAGASEADASGLEGRLRAALQDEGHIMPWDATAGRLGRPGPGVPFEPHRGARIPGTRRRGPAEYDWTPEGNLVAVNSGATISGSRLPPPDRNALHALLERNGGDIQRVQQELQRQGVERSTSTLYRWIREHNLNLANYRE